MEKNKRYQVWVYYNLGSLNGDRDGRILDIADENGGNRGGSGGGFRQRDISFYFDSIGQIRNFLLQVFSQNLIDGVALYAEYSVWGILTFKASCVDELDEQVERALIIWDEDLE